MCNQIISCRIIKGRFENTIRVKYRDGSKEDLIKYQPDEISFTKKELIQLARDEALDLFKKKDFEYLTNKFQKKES